MNLSIKPSRLLLVGLCAAVLFQLSVLAAELLIAVYPRWTGKPLRVLVQPIDPRDLFRGNYAHLEYSFNRVKGDLWLGDDTLQPGNVVYVVLTPKTLIDRQEGVAGTAETNAANVMGEAEKTKGTKERVDWVASSIVRDKPNSGRFIRGRVRHVSGSWVQALVDAQGEETGEEIEHARQYHIEYGVEAWFAPKVKAQALERELRGGAWATLYIAESGRAALVDIDTENDPAASESNGDELE